MAHEKLEKLGWSADHRLGWERWTREMEWAGPFKMPFDCPVARRWWWVAPGVPLPAPVMSRVGSPKRLVLKACVLNSLTLLGPCWAGIFCDVPGKETRTQNAECNQQSLLQKSNKRESVRSVRWNKVATKILAKVTTENANRKSPANWEKSDLTKFNRKMWRCTKLTILKENTLEKRSRGEGKEISGNTSETHWSNHGEYSGTEDKESVA